MNVFSAGEVAELRAICNVIQNPLKSKKDFASSFGYGELFIYLHPIKSVEVKRERSFN
jgi:hypothetical protein